MVTYQLTKTLDELKEIIRLQQKNLPDNMSSSEKEKQGFVTLQHSLEILKKMHNAHPHIIAKKNDKVIGYALCMLRKFKDDIPVLIPMFNEIDKSLEDTNYMVMGQICIDKKHRKQGLFRGLYKFMRQNIDTNFDAIVTEVDAKNIRSSNAHKAIGFEILKKYLSENKEWELIILRKCHNYD